jgi:L-asparagine oxygenase
MFKIPDSFGVSGSVSKPMPIIGGDFAKPELSFGLESKMVVACDDPIKLSSVNHALQELRLAFNRSDLQYQIYLDKGEFLVINNHVTVHGRSVFKVHEDGYNRWLQRTIVRQSLYEARSMQGSRYCQYA